MTKRDKLGQTLAKVVDQFKGHTDGRWYETGQDAYMTAEFANVGQATMFANRTIWDNQVVCIVTGGDWDDSLVPAQVTIKPGVSGR